MSGLLGFDSKICWVFSGAELSINYLLKYKLIFSKMQTLHISCLPPMKSDSKMWQNHWSSPLLFEILLILDFRWNGELIVCCFWVIQSCLLWGNKTMQFNIRLVVSLIQYSSSVSRIEVSCSRTINLLAACFVAFTIYLNIFHHNFFFQRIFASWSCQWLRSI